MVYMTKEQRKARDLDFAARERPRLLWNSQDGTAVRFVDAKGNVTYDFKMVVAKVPARLTEAQDNALARAKRRRTNKVLRGWLPYAQR